MLVNRVSGVAQSGFPAVVSSPSELLNVPRFSSWYPGQDEVFQRVLSWYRGPHRFLGLSAPAGSGKSLIAILAAKSSGVRTCILTATKGLQDQYMRDVAVVGGVNVKGRNNFPCVLVRGLTADDGPCHAGQPCSYRGGGCPYYDQLARALSSGLVVTNYAYYLAQTNFSTGLGDFGLLVLDEATLVFGALENHLGIELSRTSVELLGLSFPIGDLDWPLWQEWARDCRPIAEASLGQMEHDIREFHRSGDPVPGDLSRSYRYAKSVVAKLSVMESAIGRWVVEHQRQIYSFTPVWVSSYGGLLYRDIPKVMLMSALLSPKSLAILGVPDYDWFAASSRFPSANTPVCHVPASSINHRSDDAALTVWLSRIDQIIQRRLDRKGIIFTVSYDRASLILLNSQFSRFMLSHSTKNVGDVVRKFKAASSPVVLVSPSITSGWDIPEADYIIVGKIPYPDTTDVVLKARKEDDKDWPAFLAMQVLVNESARGTRSASDKCEVFIVDDNVRWFMRNYSHFAPAWFMERWKGSLSGVPEPVV